MTGPLPSPKRQKVNDPSGTDSMLSHGEDSDLMFGDDLPLEELEKVLNVNDENKNPNAPNTIQTDDDDIFGDDLPIELLDEDITALLQEADSQELSVEKDGTHLDKPRYFRYTVASIENGTYLNEDEFRVPEKYLMLLEDLTNRPTSAVLRDEWVHTKVHIGDVVHIPLDHVEDKTFPSDIIIDNERHAIIVHPDRLISATAVAESFMCTRKSVLQAKFKSIGDYTEALVHGNLIHRLLQQCLTQTDFSTAGMRKKVQAIVSSSLEELMAIDQSDDTAIDLLNKQIPDLQKFLYTYLGKNPKPKATLARDKGPDAQKLLGCKTISISRVLHVEDHIWSPTYGLKGMIDAAVEMTFWPNSKTLIVPLEIKTGKSSRFVSHRAQTALYSLLMSDRYDIGIVTGALYYTKTNSIYLIPAERKDLRGLLIARNTLACAANSKHVLPPMIRKLHSCQYCYAKDVCLVHHKAAENGNGESSGLGQYFEQRTEHVTPTAAAFYTHWQKLIDHEESDVDMLRKDTWRQPGEWRELSGLCLNNMSLDVHTDKYDGSSGFIYTFRSPAPLSTPQDLDTHRAQGLSTLFSVGDPVIVSSTTGHINLGMGFIKEIDSDYVVLSLTTELRQVPRKTTDFLEDSMQSFCHDGESTLYRIDKDELSGGMSMMRRNILTLVAREEDGGDTKRRRLIVDLEPPSFRADNQPLQLHELKGMNPAQERAVNRVLAAEDYSLLLGMPGTGKTTTVARLVAALVARKKSVFITAYTHTALDNVLAKVIDLGIDVLRVGNEERFSPEIANYMADTRDSIKTVADLEKHYTSRRVVGTTCLSISHTLFQKRKFDYCIVDEASQLTLPACVGPLRFANTFVLVGDQYQLPPTIKNTVARDQGLGISLFSLLAQAHPDAVSHLEYQYRMNEDIMEISNVLVYNHRLKCGTPAVAKRKLKLPHLEEGLEHIHRQWNLNCKLPAKHCWMAHVLDPKRNVILIDTDALNFTESRESNAITNHSEAVLVKSLVSALVRCGVPESELAVISFYRAQVRHIAMAIKSHMDVEVATVDRYQGRDKECVLISMVRSNARGNTGELLREWRRINVALTRAKSKVIMIGSVSTLQNGALFASILDIMRNKNWIYRLHADDFKRHYIDINGPSPMPAKDRPKKERKTIVGSKPVRKDKPILHDILKEINSF